jgi:GMP synthase-like glutamine amidotransferase
MKISLQVFGPLELQTNFMEYLTHNMQLMLAGLAGWWAKGEGKEQLHLFLLALRLNAFAQQYNRHKLSISPRRKRRICIFLTDNGQAWKDRSFADMFKERMCLQPQKSGANSASVKAYSGVEVDVEWAVCRLAHGEAMIDPYDFDAFIITGSRFNVRDGHTLPWFPALVKLVRQVAGLEPSPPPPSSSDGRCTATCDDGASCTNLTCKRIYGACYGHQLVAHALGGRVDTNPDGGFVLKAESLQLDAAALRQKLAPRILGDVNGSAHAYASGAAAAAAAADVKSPVLEALLACSCDAKGNGSGSGCKCCRVICSHGDCVRELPSALPCTLLASSSSCQHEMYLTGHGQGNILCTQGHPEFDFEFCVRDRILPSVLGSKRLSEQQGAAALSSFEGFSREGSGPDALSRVISEFLCR